MFTTAPPPCSRINGAAALVHRNGPVRLTERIRFQSASEVSSSGANTATPALLTSASSRPKRAEICANAAATAFASETSQCSASVSSGLARPTAARASNSPSVSSSATRQPSARKRLAVASPIPRAAPVTSATFGGLVVILHPSSSRRLHPNMAAADPEREGFVMKIVNVADMPVEQWRPGVETRLVVSAANGAAQLCIFEQWVAPGVGAPTHSHPVEEVLTVREGEAEMWIDAQR